MDAEIERLWWQGDLRGAYLLSCQLAQVHSGDPFRDSHGSLDDAERWHAHGTRAWHLARFDEAARNLDAAYQTRCTVLGERHPATLATLGRLAAHADYTDRRELAHQRFEQVIEGWIATEGKNSVQVAVAKRNYACLLRMRGELEVARRLFDESDRVFRKQVDHEDPEYLALRKARALQAVYEREYTLAVRRAEEAIARTRLTCEHPFVAAASLTRARGLQGMGEVDVARDVLRDVIASFEHGYGEHPLTALAWAVLADVLVELGATEDAAAATRRWFAIYGAFYSLATFAFASQACFRFASLGLMSDAQAIAEKVVELAPDQSHTCIAHVAGGYLRRGDQAGLAWLERAAKLARPAERANYLDALARWRRHFALTAA
jgi:tetratricopeptide (TPR) repeat protein